mmetsp:Transcript_32375/g.94739  ORF Transcript_32375/g.94739 Transcript_32375/m.94739 type:complete len:262 (-) Transcript_32375:106-891(-)
MARITKIVGCAALCFDFVAASAASTASGPCLSGSDSDNCVSRSGDEAAMLQAKLKARRGGQQICPGSGIQCNGNQCCPGAWISHNMTFPCPNADHSFGGCEMKELPEKVNCPFSESECQRNQCCRGVAESHGQTFPCPNSDPDFVGCVASGLWQGGSLLQTEQAAGDATCPGSGTHCAGNQCCPGVWISNNQTFPCPSADADYDACQIVELPRKVKCPYSGTTCNGDQCCPGVTASGNLTFPCPNAGPDFDDCQASGLWGR